MNELVNILALPLTLCLVLTAFASDADALPTVGSTRRGSSPLRSPHEGRPAM